MSPLPQFRNLMSDGGGFADETFLEKISRLGTHQVTQTSKSLKRKGPGRDTRSTSTSEREERRMKVEDIRKIAEGTAQPSCSTARKKPSCNSPPWWKRPDADQLHQSQGFSLKFEGITT